MVKSICLLAFTLIIYLTCGFINCKSIDDNLVEVVLLVRNKNHLLPLFFRFFENLNYPKKNLALFIRSDHNKDETILGLENWLSKNEHKYHSVNKKLDIFPSFYEDAILKDNLWNSERMSHLIHLKEEGLKEATKINADFVWFIDADTFHTNPYVLRHLIKQNKTVIAPLLKSTKLLSNFWGGMKSNYYYERTEEYMDIVLDKKIGVFSVSLVSGSVLINLRHPNSKKLSFQRQKLMFHPNSPDLDIINFALTAKENNIQLHVINRHEYGYMLLISESELDIKFDLDQIEELNLTQIQMKKNVQEKTRSDINPYNLDKIYCINLLRRPDRREKMEKNFELLNLNVTFVNAVDWRDLNETFLKSLDVRVLKNYDRGDITYGLIANLISHYFIWKEIIEHEYDQVPNSKLLLKPAVSFCMLGYLLSYEGAKKLVNQGPLQKLVPIDLYVSIMFDHYYEDRVKAQFSPRDLKAFAVNPMILKPTHYWGQEGHITDTATAPHVSHLTQDDFIQMKLNARLSKEEL
ncbi:Procollagen-lysine,2-oxoglutarate 5-dioxygenase 1 [Armadillidium nasatum]|uniref:Procollagen-lysine,2-oxoglutarate 5-dioxygenase 1 n=1 Tax=Armadillidium nasatum TaxID=96803 RepID=A0A5N5TDA9_9CRUS|nr:Procollagen-lysine,2-oxoglutarate 5-dioxygenase 1 [Armadillidium nasatum]